jgi:hypothetical protein
MKRAVKRDDIARPTALRQRMCNIRYKNESHGRLRPASKPVERRGDGAPTDTKEKKMNVKKTTLIVLLAFSVTTSYLGAQTLGDVNNSGTVDIIDALLTAQSYVGLNPADFNVTAADVNGNGSADIVDALLIAQYYVGLITEFPASGQTPAPTAVTTPIPGSGTGNTPWDWTSVFGTGQSLAVGEQGNPVKVTSQPYNNLKLSTGTLAWPVDPNNSTLTMVPLIEPIGRFAPTYPSSWPTNIAGETQHSAMGNQITTLVRNKLGRDYVSVQGDVGENGQCMVYLKKNATQSDVNGRAFEATLVEARAIKRLAQAAGKTYGIGAIIITHGECDSGNTGYENDLYTLWSDYNNDLRSITGQSQTIQMLVSQQNSQGDNSAATLAQWKVGVDYPSSIACVGPLYSYPYATDNIHLTTDGYEQLGEKYGEVYYERVIMGNQWQPLQPIAIQRSGRVITVQFHVPVAPLVFDTTFQTPHQESTEWSAGKGFEVYNQYNGRVTISSVSVSGDTVQITCSTDPGAGARVDYAMAQSSSSMSSPQNGTRRWGLLRDSDSFTGSTTKKTLRNWCVAFQMSVP